jgi:hypothetical protein
LKKRIGFTILAIMIVSLISLLLLVKFGNGEKTVADLINNEGSMKLKIIHEEKTDKGSIVFCNTVGRDGLSTVIVRKTISGYKDVYSGGEADIKRVANKFGVSYTYYPNIEKTSLPIYFGIIGNPAINKVKIVEKKRNIEGQAKIINANGMRIWLVYMNKFEGSDFDIIGLSADGRELTKIDGDISPYYAEQKPFKGYQN